MADAQQAPTEINVVSLNCWGLKYLADHRVERLKEIGVRIASAEPVPHIVGLQECWAMEDYLSIRKSTKHILPYGKFYHSGIFGGGLAILSKWPLVESSMVRYPLNGRPTAFFRGDWFVGKGVACAKIRFGPNVKDVVEVFTTHLHAPYVMKQGIHDSYLCHRTAQAWEIAKLMRGAAERGHLVLGLGDFNMITDSLAHKLITTHSTLRDAWMVLHPDCSLGSSIDDTEIARKRPVPTAEYNIAENGATCDSVFNTWRWNQTQQKAIGPNKPKINIPGHTLDPKAKRLDYIFTNTCFDSSKPERGGWLVKNARVGMMYRHPELQCSLSDHFSVETTLAYTKPYMAEEYPKELNYDGATMSSTGSYIELHDLDPQFQHLTSAHLPASIYDEILAMIHRYRARERLQRQCRLGHFIGQFFISIGCLVAVWWSPYNYVSFLLMLVSTLGLSAGVIDGLIGGLFVGSEIRALKEFEWEISNAKAAANGDPHVMEDEGIKDL